MHLPQSVCLPTQGSVWTSVLCADAGADMLLALPHVGCSCCSHNLARCLYVWMCCWSSRERVHEMYAGHCSCPLLSITVCHTYLSIGGLYSTTQTTLICRCWCIADMKCVKPKRTILHQHACRARTNDSPNAQDTLFLIMLWRPAAFRERLAFPPHVLVSAVML